MFNYKGITKNKDAWKFGNGIIKNKGFYYLTNGNFEFSYFFAESDGEFNIRGLSYPIIKETLSISFGKFDRNNKEIFTNDIVKVPAGYCSDYFYKSTEAIIMFEDYEFFLWNKNDEHNVTWQYFEWNQLEITGNRFDYLIV